MIEIYFSGCCPYFLKIISSLLIPEVLGQHGHGDLCAVSGAALQGVDQLEKVGGALRMLSIPENLKYELTQNYLR